MSTEQWATIIFRNGWRLHVGQTVINVIDQIAEASKSAHGGLSFVTLTLRGDEFASVNALDIMAVVALVPADEGSMSKTLRAQAGANAADRSSASRDVRA